MRRILFRADADPAVGTGDLASLLNLAAILNPSSWEPHFLVRRHAFAKDLLTARGSARVRWLDPCLDVAGEVSAINDAVEELNAAAMVIELTRRHLTDYTGFTEATVKAGIVFDAAVPENFDVVLNWDVTAESAFAGKSFPRAELLLGPRYVLLPPSFDLARVRNRVQVRPARTVLVMMGGADEHDLTRAACTALAGLGRDISLHVVLGPGYAQEDRLRADLMGWGFEHRVERNVAEMFTRYIDCDFAVGTGGLTLSEMVATRTPGAVVAAYTHQVARCKYFAALGAVAYLGFRTVEQGALAAALDNECRLTDTDFFQPRALAHAVERAVQRRGL